MSEGLVGTIIYLAVAGRETPQVSVFVAEPFEQVFGQFEDRHATPVQMFTTEKGDRIAVNRDQVTHFRSRTRGTVMAAG